ncbi:MAG: DUF6882 domain-containing protein [Nitrospirota bacterium]
MKKIYEYFEKYALLSLEKQEKLSTLIGEHTWEISPDSGAIRFNGEVEFPFQALGTESDNTLTWLWAWADEQTEIPERLLTSSRQCRDWGMAAGVEEFSSPSVDLNRADGHLIAMIASEVCRASCYYRGPYEGGAVFILLFGDAIDRQHPFDLKSLSRQFMNIISLYDFNHRNALLAYLRAKNLVFVEKGPLITAELASGEDLAAEFDDQGRLQSISGEAVSS